MTAPNDVAALVERLERSRAALGKSCWIEVAEILTAQVSITQAVATIAALTTARETAERERDDHYKGLLSERNRRKRHAERVAALQAEVERAKEDSARLDWLSKTISAEVRHDGWEDGSWQVFSAIGNRSDQKWKLLGDREDLRDAIDIARSASRKENTP